MLCQLLDHSIVNVNSKIRLKADPAWKCDTVDEKWVETSPGRVLFNSALHPDLRYINKTINKKEMGSLWIRYDKVGQIRDGRRDARRDKDAGVSLVTIQRNKPVGDACASGEERDPDITLQQEEDLTSQYEMGILTEDEYMRQKDILWSDAGRRIADKIMDSMDETNPLRIMVDSGARGSRGQVAQMAGIRGLMADPSGRIIAILPWPTSKKASTQWNTLYIDPRSKKRTADTALHGKVRLSYETPG